MGLGQFLVLYLMIGSGVAAAVYVFSARRAWPLFEMASALIFWPLYLPILLSRLPAGNDTPEAATPMTPLDELSETIARVDAELDAALRSLDGWAEGVLVREKERLHELRSAWGVQAQRVREMDRLLSRPETIGLLTCECRPEDLGNGEFSARLRSSQEAVRHNLQRLQRVRAKTYEDLVATLAWVRELVSMIHLAKFTGAPPSRAEELVAQIAAAVDGLSALTWQDDTLDLASRERRRVSSLDASGNPV